MMLRSGQQINSQAGTLQGCSRAGSCGDALTPIQICAGVELHAGELRKHIQSAA